MVFFKMHNFFIHDLNVYQTCWMTIIEACILTFIQSSAFLSPFLLFSTVGGGGGVVKKKCSYNVG
jgi:hypothetical protein